jgi:hypothetical protein
MTVMIDDGKVPGFAQQGCWLSCHDGQRDMRRQFTKEKVAANALLTAIKKSDVRKYLPDSRTDPSDWKTGSRSRKSRRSSPRAVSSTSSSGVPIAAAPWGWRTMVTCSNGG